MANLRRKIQAERTYKRPSSAEFLHTIQEKKGSFLKFKLDENKVLERALWAYPDQIATALKYGSMIVFDTTFNTNQ